MRSANDVKLPALLEEPAAKRLIRVAFAFAAVALSVYAVSTRWGEVSRDLARIAWLRSATSVPLMLLALLCGMVSWRFLLATLGSRLPLVHAGRIYSMGQLGKYLPGSIWPIVAQMELGREYDVPRRRSMVAIVMAILVSLISGLTLCCLALPVLIANGHGGLRWLLLALPLALPLLHPRVLWALLKRAPLLGLDRTLGEAPRLSSMAGPVGWAVLSWVFYGLHLVVLAGAFRGSSGASILVTSIGGYALAWSAGLIAFLLPAGAGARDVVLVFALTSQLPLSAAVAVAVVSRAVTTACDLGWAALAAVSVRRRLGSLKQGRHTPLGAVDAGQFDQPAVASLFDLPDTIDPHCTLTAGDR